MQIQVHRCKTAITTRILHGRKLWRKWKNSLSHKIISTRKRDGFYGINYYFLFFGYQQQLVPCKGYL